jgi:hypothetical protein
MELRRQAEGDPEPAKSMGPWFWSWLLNAALQRGWQPQGTTVAVEAHTDPDVRVPDRFQPDYQPARQLMWKQVTREDAEALAVALEDVLHALGRGEVPLLVPDISNAPVFLKEDSYLTRTRRLLKALDTFTVYLREGGFVFSMEHR